MILAASGHLRLMSPSWAEEQRDLLHDYDDPLHSPALCFHYDHSNRSLKDCYNSVFLYQKYIEAELEKFEPDLVIVWHQFNAFHFIIAEWCDRHSVPIMFGESGLLPGSWCFEFEGQMGESWISKSPSDFQSLPITTRDRRNAAAYLKFAVSNGLNRKRDTVSFSNEQIKNKIVSDPRPKILYAGINDYKTGLMPFHPKRTLKHSGDFSNTESGLEYLIELAKKNDWLVLYKPHPSIKHSSDLVSINSGTVVQIDKMVNLVEAIKLADILVTLVSQSAYMSVIHGKPTVLLGRMQLTGSGLVNEAPVRTLVERELKDALKKNILSERDLIVDHIARLIRYYLVSDSHHERGFFKYNLKDFARALRYIN